MTENKIVEYRAEIKALISDKDSINALAQNTFKGLEVNNIPQALMKGRLKGFEIEDFFVGNVYALPFWNKREGKQDFSLVTAIDYSRKMAMKSGQSGKSEPVYEEDKNGKLTTCSITIWKKDGDERGYTAKVYFNEYDTKKNLWVSKPRTMIAKVAEAHALRSAFPEELHNAYIAEEFEKEAIDVEPEVDMVDDGKEVEKVIKMIENFKDEPNLAEYYKTLDSKFIKNKLVVEAYKKQKESCQKSKTTE